MQSDPPTPNGAPRRSRAVLGTIALAVSVALFCLIFVAETADLPFRMPRSWYVNRSLWYFFALAAIAAGGYLLKSRPRNPAGWQASRPGMRFRRVVLYTRKDCELCGAAALILKEYGDYMPPAEEIDIDTDRGLIELFGTRVPVVEIDGKIRFREGIEETLLRRLIEGTPPLDSTMDERGSHSP